MRRIATPSRSNACSRERLRMLTWPGGIFKIPNANTVVARTAVDADVAEDNRLYPHHSYLHRIGLWLPSAT